MVSSELKLMTIDVRWKVIYSLNYCQALTSSNTVIPFGIRQGFGVIPNDTLVSILYLTQNSTHSKC